jgi:putative tributyrin esterase
MRLEMLDMRQSDTLFPLRQLGKTILFTVFLFLIVCPAFAQDTLIYKTEYLSKPDTVLIFKPRQYTSGENWPLVYLLHGYGGSYNRWNSIMNAQKQADRYGFIIVCPDGNLNSWYINSPVKKNSQFQSFFFNELYPDILKKYKVNPNQVFISGLSMGGHGALSLFIHRPDLFLSAGSTSGVMDLQKSSDKYGLTSLTGLASESGGWNNFSVLYQIEKLKGSEKQLIFDCGTEDPFHPGNVQLMEKCDSLSLKATFISQPGKHDRYYWEKSIQKHFEFFKAQIN